MLIINSVHLKLTDPIFIELLEYVLRKGILPGPSVVARFCPGIWLCPREGPVDRPRDEPEDDVSKEFVPNSVPCSDEVVYDMTGTGGTPWTGASSPFLVIVEPDRDLGENISLALGADATRRINRGNAPIGLGDNGTPCRYADGVERGIIEGCEG